MSAVGFEFGNRSLQYSQGFPAFPSALGSLDGNDEGGDRQDKNGKSN